MPPAYVGYSSTDAIFGAKAMGASFVPVAGGEYDIQEIKPVGPAEAGGVIDDWVYYIYEISAGGACDAESYVYIDVANDSGVEKNGWYDAADGTTPISRTFKAGEGFAFSSDVEGAAMQSAGQVDVSEVVVPAVFGCKAMTNPFPVDHKIENIVPVPPEGSGIDDWVYYIYEISAGGACDAESYVYIDVANESGVEKSGWYDAADGTTPIDRTFKPGEGFAFSSDVEDAGVAFEAHSL